MNLINQGNLVIRVFVGTVTFVAYSVERSNFTLPVSRLLRYHAFRGINGMGYTEQVVKL